MKLQTNVKAGGSKGHKHHGCGGSGHNTALINISDNQVNILAFGNEN